MNMVSQLKKITIIFLLLSLYLLISCKPETRAELNSSLIKSAESGDFDKVKLKLKNGADINAKGNDGLTAIYKASEKGYSKIVEFLLKNGAELNTNSDAYYKTPLEIAALNGHLSIVKVLLPYTKKSNEISLALSSAVSNGNFAVVDYFLKSLNGRKINLTPSLRKAAVNNKFRLLIKLEKHGADFNKGDILSHAAGSGNLGLVKYVFNKLNYNAKARSLAVLSAVEKGSPEILRFLLKKMPKKRGLKFAFRNAAKSGQTDLLRIFINNKTNVNANYRKGGSALFNAVAYFRHEAVKLLLENGAKINTGYQHDKYIHNLYPNNFTPLMVSVKNNDEKSLNFLLAYGKAKNSTHISSCLNVAIDNGNVKILKRLLKLNTNINTSGVYGKIPLINACRKENKALISILIKSGAKINIRDRFRNSALSISILSKNDKLIDYLLEKGADINFNSREIIFNLTRTGKLKTLNYFANNGLKFTRRNTIKAYLYSRKNKLVNFIKFFKTRGFGY